MTPGDFRTFRFWRTYMIVLSVVSILQGILTAITASPDPFGIYSAQLNIFFWNASTPPENVEAFRRFIFALLGGTLAGYFVFTLFLILYPFKERQLWSHNAIATGILTWFTIDSAMTIYHGAYFNLYLVNFPTLVFWSLPLVFTRKYMQRV